jgi:small subunit ribosomal protein S1
MSENPGEASRDPSQSFSEPARRKVLIGSQRDAADVSLRPARPPQHAPAPGARSDKPASTDPVVEPETAAVELPPVPEPAIAPNMPEPVSAAPQAVVSAPVAAPVAVNAINEAERRAALRSAEIDKELEASLDDLKLESLIGNPSGPLEVDSENRIRGIVTRIHNENVFFSLKGHYQGVASIRQFREPPREGAMIDVIVTAFREEEGLYEVAVPGSAMSVADWADITEGAVVEARITGSNTGGLECNVNNIRGFIPASQIAIGHVENFGEFTNQKLACVVTEVNPGRKRLVLSRRAVLEREAQVKKQEILKTLQPGDLMDGVVTRLMDFGAFVDIGGVEGLVHVSKLSWERVNHPREILQPGQRVRVKVEKIAEDTGKIGLSMRDTVESPWASVDQKYPAGSTVSGTVTRIAQFGAFVKLEPGIEGLVHISELAHHRVIAVKNVVKEGDAVNVKILSVDPASQKISLSMKATQPKPEAPQSATKEEPDEPVRESAIKGSGQPLKGGRGRNSGGDQFGLNW